MRIQHPDIAGLTREIPDDATDRWLAAGWVRAEVIKPCPTCGAVRNEPCTTPSGNATKRHAKRA